MFMAPFWPSGGILGDWNFFMGQAVAIWVEEHVVRAVRLLGMPEGTRFGKDCWIPVGGSWDAVLAHGLEERDY